MTALEEWVIWSSLHAEHRPGPQSNMSLKETDIYCKIVTSLSGLEDGLERLTKSFELLREYDKGI